MANSEHPKSAVYRLIAQICNQKNNSNNVTITIHDPEFSHEYQAQGNKNIFKCSVLVLYNNQSVSFMSDCYLNKKDCEYCVFEKILTFLMNKLDTSLDSKTVKSIKSTNSVNSVKSINSINSVNSVKSIKSIKSVKSVKSSDKQISKINTNISSKSKNTEQQSIFDLIKSDYDMTNIMFVIVDFENVSKQNEISLLYDVVIPGKTIHIVKIAGFCSSVKQNSDIVVRSNRKDAVDHYISYLIGLLESKDTLPIIYIITRDKFGSCLQDFCNNVTHCSDVADFLTDIDIESHIM